MMKRFLFVFLSFMLLAAGASAQLWTKGSVVTSASGITSGTLYAIQSTRATGYGWICDDGSGKVNNPTAHNNLGDTGLWYITPSGSGYTFQNYATGNYITLPSSVVHLTTSASASDAGVFNLSFSGSVSGAAFPSSTYAPTVTMNNGTDKSTGKGTAYSQSSLTLTSLAASGLAGMTVTASGGTIDAANWPDTRCIAIKPSSSTDEDTWTITAPSGYAITGYSIGGYCNTAGSSYTLSAGGQTG